MSGLSVVLEGHRHHQKKRTNMPQVIHSATISPRSSSFLDHCFLCNAKLLPVNDIYMYKGDRAFCSVECRYQQISMDDQEETTLKEDDSSKSAVDAIDHATGSSSATSPASSRARRVARNHHHHVPMSSTR